MDNAWLKMMFKMSTASLHTSRQTTTRLTNRCCDVTLMSLFGTALPSMQKIFTHLHAWSIAMEHAKNYEIRCKIISNIRTKWVAPFLRAMSFRFLSTKVLQGSVGTCVNYGRIFINYLTANLLQSVKVKEFWKSVSISRSYRQKLSGTFFSGHGVVTVLQVGKKQVYNSLIIIIVIITVIIKLCPRVVKIQLH